MKGALACYLEVLHLPSARDIRLPGDLMIAGIVGETTSLRVCGAHKGQLGVFVRAAHVTAPMCAVPGR